VLRHVYPQRSRGRAYGMITSAMWLGGALASYGIGAWLNIEPDAFRAYLPIAAVLQLMGIGILLLLSRATGAFQEGAAAPGRPLAWSTLLAPIVNMRQVLKADRTFYRYEAAFMTYGIGWMICYALVPLLVTDKLKMNYEEVANSTQVAVLLAMVVLLIPAGWLIDRIGPSRTSGLSFALLTVYPIGLVLARNPLELAIVSGVYGVAAAGVNVGWMLGPVSLAPTAAQVPQYVAIHSTLVGLRGTLFQGLGVLLYTVSGSFLWPLLVAAVSFAWAAVQMWRLHGRIAEAKRSQIGAPTGAGVDTLAGRGGVDEVEGA